MTVDEFRDTLSEDTPPSGAGLALTALWYDAKGDWGKAHTAAQEDASEDGAWVHAYLHRVEGDPGNAAYWYRRARRPVAQGKLADEWTAIAEELLAR